MKIRLLSTALAVTFALYGTSAKATTYEVADWYGSYSRMTSVSNGDTASPTFNYNSSGTGAGTIWAYLPESITLNDGQTLTLNTSITFNFKTGTEGSAELRFGFFKSGDSRPDGGQRSILSTNPDYPAWTNGWTGFLTTTDQNSTTHAGRIWKRSVAGTDTNFSSSVSTTTTELAEKFTSNYLFKDGEPVELTLSLGREGDNLIFFGSLGADAFSGTFVNAFVGDYPAIFDVIGFNGGTSMSNGVKSVQFANTTVSVIPEPATLGMLIGGVGLLLLGATRSRRPCLHSRVSFFF